MLGPFVFIGRLFAVVEVILFIVTVLCVYAFVWRRGGLEWD